MGCVLVDFYYSLSSLQSPLTGYALDDNDDYQIYYSQAKTLCLGDGSAAAEMLYHDDWLWMKRVQLMECALALADHSYRRYYYY